MVMWILVCDILVLFLLNFLWWRDVGLTYGAAYFDMSSEFLV